MLGLFKKKDKFPVDIEQINKWHNRFSDLWHYLHNHSNGNHKARDIYNGCRWLYMAWNYLDSDDTKEFDGLVIFLKSMNPEKENYQITCEAIVKHIKLLTPEKLYIATKHFSDPSIKEWIKIIIENKKNGRE